MSRHFALAVPLLSGLSMFAAPTARATTIHVNGTTGDDTWDGLCETWDGGTCGPKATIQAGIDAADPGDDVVIADGTYTGDGNRDLEFDGIAITVRSASGNPSTCIIDCQGTEVDPHRGFYFRGGEGPDSVVEGLTVTNGSTTSGGGVACVRDSGPTLINCTIRGNSASFYGGGIRCYTGGHPTLINCTISENSADDEGGGVWCDPSSFGLTLLINCTISNNSAGGAGGGVHCYHGHSTIINCTISNNSAGAAGGGVYCLKYGDLRLINCTICGNSAANGGGGFCSAISSPTLTNCIFWSNTPEDIHVSSDNPVVTYCSLQGGWPGEGNIDADPLFIDPDGPDDDPNTWEDNDYHLHPNSPCIDAGNNMAVPSDTLDLDGDDDVAEPLPFDLDANPRFLDVPATPDSGKGTPPIVDMGAYELGLGDFDDDGALDYEDGCPTDPDKTEPGDCGCGVVDTDSDGDGTADCIDGCPDDPDKIDPGACGCHFPDTDTDGDGTADCIDGCPDDPNKIDPGACGCGVVDTDTDGDGTADCIDACPDDPSKTQPGVCGCGTSDTDRDGDGVPDCEDGCPDDPDKTEPGVCGCGVPEDACGDSEQPIPTAFCPSIATLTLTLTFLGLMRTRFGRRHTRR